MLYLDIEKESRTGRRKKISNMKMKNRIRVGLKNKCTAVAVDAVVVAAAAVERNEAKIKQMSV
jgi:hypothetical protein